ncbi:MAG TPA: hypothetical protein VJ735_17670 [Actinomycetes bacterium]|nr:hypothetical protein [Actinomycetes bacterium]
MKRVRMLVVLGAIAVALPLGLSAAHATGGGSSANQVTIQERVDYDNVGTNLDVGLNVRCSGGSGSVIVNVTQSPPQTPYPVAAGSGPQFVVCDNKTHTVAVTLVGFGFDAGRAKATADLTTDLGGSTHAERWVTIVPV